MKANGSRGRGNITSSEAQHQPYNPLEYVANTLTTLALHNIGLDHFPGGWCCLTALTALQQLDLWHEYTSSASSCGEVLPHLTTLTRLCLHSQLEDTLQAAIGVLPRLRELKLWDFDRYDSPQGPGKHLALPSSLTRLQVDRPQLAISSHSTASLAALQHLQLGKIYRMDPTLIAGMLQLTHLQLRMELVNFSDHSMATLAAGLRHLLQLQHLELKFDDDSDSARDLPAVERQQC
jgi:hypothetical protein